MNRSDRAMRRTSESFSESLILFSLGSMTDLPELSMQETDSKPQYPHWGALGTILWSALVVILYTISQLLTAIIYLAITRPGLSSAQLQAIGPELMHDGVLLSIGTFVGAAVVCPVIFVIAKLKRGSKLRDYLGLTLPNKWQWLRWFLAVAAVCLLYDAISLLAGKPIVPEFMPKTYASMKDPWILWLALMVGAPLSEELFFRGFLIKGLSGCALRWYGAVMISAATWALIHVQYGFYDVAMVFCLGLVLGTARVKTGSTLLTMGLHSLVNLGATLETVIRLHAGSP